MTRKVAHPQVRVPTDLWSGLHLSKSADFEALKKNDVSIKYFLLIFLHSAEVSIGLINLVTALLTYLSTKSKFVPLFLTIATKRV